MKRLVFALTIGLALLTAACGGGGGPTINPPPPTGKYSRASLSGTYAFITSGTLITSTTETSIARVGSFVADGNGGITGGIEDVNVSGPVQSSTVAAITGGSYTVNADGRGAMTLNFQGGNSIDFGIVLTSTSDGLMIDETTFTNASNQASTGSGNFVLQQSAPFDLTKLTGNYVFDFSGLDGAQNPESFIGQLTLDGTTGTVSGVFDDNDGGTLASNAIMTPGTFSQDPTAFASFGRGTATFAGQDFAFYIVDANRVRFISTTNGMISGDAVAQSNNPANLNAINGGFAFIVAGGSASGGLIRVGRLTATNGALGQIFMDVNDASTEVPVNPSNGSITSYDPTTGRGTLSFTSTTATFSFVFYLSSPNDAVIQEVTTAGGSATALVVADGSLLAQSGGPFSSSNITGTYALNWSGQVTAGGTGLTDEEDLVGQVTVTNLALSGTADIFQFTSNTLTPVFDDPIGAQSLITFNNGNGTGDDGKRVFMNVQLSGQSPVDMVVYIVSPQLAFFANRDNNGSQRIVAGILKAQQ